MRRSIAFARLCLFVGNITGKSVQLWTKKLLEQMGNGAGIIPLNSLSGSTLPLVIVLFSIVVDVRDIPNHMSN